MQLHPNAAVRVLRNEHERLREAAETCAIDIARRRAPQDANLEETLERIRAADAAGRVIEQIGAEADEIEDALAILEAGFEAEQGQLAFAAA